MTSAFRALIDKHRDAGTCHICGLAVDPARGYHGATGAHWDCTEAEKAKTDEVMAKGDRALKALGFKPRRRREGEGEVAQKCKTLATQALQELLGVPIYRVTMWNQKGVYRGPRWDLDSWGLHFYFEKHGSEFSGSASSLATMTQCLTFKRLKAVEDGVSCYSLWEHK